MADFRRQYPVETSELDSAVEAADGYRELHGRLSRDDLPRFRSTFKTYLNKNTIMEIAQFQAQLNRQSGLIKERIDTINRSLVDVDYNRDRYIRLEPEPTPNTEMISTFGKRSSISRVAPRLASVAIARTRFATSVPG